MSKRPKSRRAPAKTAKVSVQSEGVGGQSNLTRDSRHIREDMRLAALAARQRWPTTPEIREAIANKVARVTIAAEDNRTTLMGARVYAQMEGQNQADEHKGKPDKVDLTLTGSAEDQAEAVLNRIEALAAAQGVKLNGRPRKR